MKKSKKLIGIVIAVIVIFALLKFMTPEGGSVIETAGSVAQSMLSDSTSDSKGGQSQAPAQDEPGMDDAQETDDSEADTAAAEEPDSSEETAAIDEDGVYTSKEDVALYIYTYGKLPSNFITKKEAEKAGWPGGSLEPYCPGKCIGGSHFGNYEGLLPDKKGRSWTECDIDTLGAKSRGAKRIIFSNDGLIYYTDDHYESFELLYGEP